eukprot:scaffold100305_cov32-Tisochrysis_lutea.AAC.3
MQQRAPALQLHAAAARRDCYCSCVASSKSHHDPSGWPIEWRRRLETLGIPAHVGASVKYRTCRPLRLAGIELERALASSSRSSLLECSSRATLLLAAAALNAPVSTSPATKGVLPPRMPTLVFGLPRTRL